MEGEGFGVEDGVRLGLDELHAGERLLIVNRVRVCGRWETRRFHMHRVRGRHGAEAGSVRCRLGAELGEVEVGTGLISHVHGLPQALLRVISVEDDTV